MACLVESLFLYCIVLTTSSAIHRWNKIIISRIMLAIMSVTSVKSSLERDEYDNWADRLSARMKNVDRRTKLTDKIAHPVWLLTRYVDWFVRKICRCVRRSKLVAQLSANYCSFLSSAAAAMASRCELYQRTRRRTGQLNTISQRADEGNTDPSVVIRSTKSLAPASFNEVVAVFYHDPPAP